MSMDIESVLQRTKGRLAVVQGLITLSPHTSLTADEVLGITVILRDVMGEFEALAARFMGALPVKEVSP